MTFLKSILGIFVSVFAPIILVFIGSGLISLGINYNFQIVNIMGLVLIAVGVIWGIAIFFYFGGAD